MRVRITAPATNTGSREADAATRTGTRFQQLLRAERAVLDASQNFVHDQSQQTFEQLFNAVVQLQHARGEMEKA